MITLLIAMQAVPEELYEAARVDGASHRQSLRSITVPLILPTIALVVLLLVVGSYLAFDQFYIITRGGPNNSTITATYWIYNQAFVGLQVRLLHRALGGPDAVPGRPGCHPAAHPAPRRDGVAEAVMTQSTADARSVRRACARPRATAAVAAILFFGGLRARDAVRDAHGVGRRSRRSCRRSRPSKGPPPWLPTQHRHRQLRGARPTYGAGIGNYI